MEHRPVTYIVSVFDKPQWRTVLTTKDKAAAEDRGDHAEEALDKVGGNLKGSAGDG